MIYKPKEGSKAYEYIKGILEAEHKEEKAYQARVEDALHSDAGCSQEVLLPFEALHKEFLR